MNFTQEQVDDASKRLVADHDAADRLSDAIDIMANKSSVGFGAFRQATPDEFLPAHIEARLAAAKRSRSAAGSAAHKLLLIESQFEEFSALHERKEAWVAEQNKRAFDTRLRADIEARARAAAANWRSSGPGKTLTAIVVNAERELLALRGCLSLGADLSAWEADAIAIARRFVAEVTEAAEALKPKCESA